MRTCALVRGSLLALLATFLSFGSARAQDAPFDPAAHFAKICAGCHTIGDGDKVGPDLIGVDKRRDKDKFTAFIRGPGAAIDAGDATATALFAKFKVRMPDQALTDEQATAMYDYLADCTAKGGCKPGAALRTAAEATPQEIAAGKAIFEGGRTLAAGGPACMSCHTARGVGVIGGGTLGRELTFAYARLGDAGTNAAITSTTQPLHRRAYKRIKDDEAYDLKAYLWSLSRDGTPTRPDTTFVYLGVLGLFGALGAIGMAWSGRLDGVRKNFAKRGQ